MKKLYKGFDKDLKCRDFQYEIGKEYTHAGKVKCCESGFHACENPMDVLEYYPPNKTTRFCEVEGDGQEDKDGNKSCFERIKIVAEIGLTGLIQAGIKFCFNRVKWTDKTSATGDCSGASATGDYSGASATGNCSGASATGYKSGASATGDYSGASATGDKSGASATGDYSGASATGDYSGASATGNCSGASATGYKSGASAGKGSVAISVGRETRAKGAIGSWLVLTECHHDKEKDEDFIDLVRVVKVDGKIIKADTWYTLKNGKFVKAKLEDYE